MPKTASYGTWTSPITPEVALKSDTHVDELFVDPITSTIYHIDRRPAENGRNTIVNTEQAADVVGKEWNVRSGVHEYGGGSAVSHDGVIYFSNITDGRVYRVKEGEQPEPITPENENFRYANFAIHPQHKHLIAAIREDHTNPAPSEIVNALCVINAQEKTVSPLVAGADFYSTPTFTPDGTHIAWLQWYHPDMPWEGSEVYVADVVTDGTSLSVSNAKSVAGKRLDISTGYPAWASNDLLLFISDASGYYNPWKYLVSTGEASPVLSEPVSEDFAEPMWRLGVSTSCPLDEEGKTALFSALKEGRSVLYLLNLQTGTLEQLECPYVHIQFMRRVTHDAVVFLGTKDDDAERVILCNIKDYAKPKFTRLGPVREDNELPFPRSYISIPRSISLKDSETGDPVHVLYYPPTNPDFVAPEGEVPPAVFQAHGGPTSRASMGLSLIRQFYTSRGYAWIDVNYGGSSGFGREYTLRLRGKWGVVDVQDVVTAVQQLAVPPYSLIDPQRTALTGGSAGGYTALKTACSFPDAFAAVTSSYGISDLFKLAEFTHKFESQYLFKLAGGTPEEIPDIYKERSPVFLADAIRAPLLVLQGSEDKVVPPNQAEGIVDTVRKHDGRVEYIVFQGEGHGWRKEENQHTALLKELEFYEDVFGLKK